MPKISYMGDGTTTEFNFNFPYFEDDNIIVTKNNESATGYTIVGTPAGLNADIPYTGGKVVFDVAPSALDNITISRSLPLTRIVDYQPTEKINPTLLNQDINYTIEVLKDMSTELNDFHTQYASIIDKTETQTLLARIDEIDEEIEDTNQTITDFYTDIQNGRLMSKDDFYSYTTNCITEIPQDIKLELNDGVLTLKAGSKYYKPDGTYVETTNDYTIPIAWNAAASGIIVIGNNSYACYAENRQLSGTTNPTGLQGNSYLFWNTTENKIYNTINGGSTWTVAPDCSIPIARVTWGADNKVTSIDEIYNGFGYMGSTIYILPGVKGLIPDGRNPNGTLKNKTMNNTSLQTKTKTSAYSGIIAIYSTGGLDGFGALSYDSDANLNYNSNGTQYVINAGTVVFGTNGLVSSFSPKKVLTI